MKKTINWVIGSFFRTLGRIICYITVGFLLFLLASKFGLVLSVKADTTPNYWITNTDVPTYFDLFDCTETACNRVDSSNYTNEMIELGQTGGRQFPVTTRTYNLKGNGIVLRTSSNARYNTGYLYQTTFYVCSDVVMDNATNVIYPSYYGDAFTNNNVFQSSNSYVLSGLPGLAPQWNNCYAFSTIFSPGENGTYINLRLKSTTDIRGYYALVGFKSESLGLYSGEVEKIVKDSGFATAQSVDEVKNSVNEVKQETKKIDDTINNSDTTSAESDANGFFNNFQESDFGLSSIITAPLRAINAMLNNSCVAPSATYKGQTFSLPCGSMLWNRPNADALKTFLNVMFGGFLAYFVIRKFFLDIENLKNPNSDKVEVDKL